MNLDQTTISHMAIGAVLVFLLLRYLGWQKPGGKPPTPPPAAPLAPGAWFPQYGPVPPAALGNAVAFDIPNLPVKAIITLQPEGDKK
jgi:hypothetical protein